MLNCPKCNTELFLIPVPKGFRLKSVNDFINEISPILEKYCSTEQPQHKNLHKKIKIEFIKNAISGAEIARKCGLDRTNVYHVLSGHSKSKKIRQAISDAIGIPIAELWPN